MFLTFWNIYFDNLDWPQATSGETESEVHWSLIHCLYFPTLPSLSCFTSWPQIPYSVTPSCVWKMTGDLLGHTYASWLLPWWQPAPPQCQSGMNQKWLLQRWCYRPESIEQTFHTTGFPQSLRCSYSVLNSACTPSPKGPPPGRHCVDFFSLKVCRVAERLRVN
jgi:hypothetical protein